MSETSLPLTAPPSSIAERLQALLLLALFCFLWSSAFTAAKIGIADCPPLLLAIRFLLGGAVLSGVVLWRQGPAAFGHREEWGRLALLGLSNHAFYLCLGYVAMQTISSGLAAVIISTNPILTAALAALLLGERFTWRKGLGLLLGLLGVAVILRSRLSFGADDHIGMLFSIGAAIGLAGGTILYKKLPTRSDPTAGLSIQLLAAGAGLLPVALLLEDAGTIRWGIGLIGALLYLAIAVSIGAYGLWFMLLRRGSATKASSLHFLMPPLGLLLGHVVLGEPLIAVDFLGILPVALGIWLVTRTR
ncbi:MAG TPA: DMT family transporter [Ferrovibrio sp.]|uniref:DMT family transporter n=1 Tax=Ferrovibrio sp. TaxID=1917215 RepID=UPI002ED1D19C